MQNPWKCGLTGHVDKHLVDDCIGVVLEESVVEVTNKAARIVSEAVWAGIGVDVEAVRYYIVHNRPKVQLPVNKGTIVNETAACAWRTVESRGVLDGNGEGLESPVAAGNILAIARHGRVGAVNQRISR